MRAKAAFLVLFALLIGALTGCQGNHTGNYTGSDAKSRTESASLLVKEEGSVNGESLYYIEYEYDQYGNEISRKSYNADGSEGDWLRYCYDELDFLCEFMQVEGYDENDRSSAYFSKYADYEFAYDSYGRLTRMRTGQLAHAYEGVTMIEYSYETKNVQPQPQETPAPLTETAYLKISETTTALDEPDDTHIEYEYNAYGEEISENRGDTLYKMVYDRNGNVIIRSTYDLDPETGESTFLHRHVTAYDIQGRKIYYGQNERGDMLNTNGYISYYSYEGDNEDWTKGETTMRPLAEDDPAYDLMNQIIEKDYGEYGIEGERTYSKSGELLSSYAYRYETGMYDDTNHFVSCEKLNTDTGESLSAEYKVYNPDDVLIGIDTYRSSLLSNRHMYEYWADGTIKNEFVSEYEQAAGSAKTSITEYREDGQVLREEYSDNFGESSAEYTYDENANLLEVIRTMHDDSGVTIHKTEYQYDEHGNCVKKTAYDEHGVVTRTTEYTYEARQVLKRAA